MICLHILSRKRHCQFENTTRLPSPWQVELSHKTDDQRRACDKLKGHGNPIQTPQSLPVGKDSLVAKAGGIPLEELGMVDLPKNKSGQVVHWEKPILQAWNISESAALATLDEFASVGKGSPSVHKDRGNIVAVGCSKA